MGRRKPAKNVLSRDLHQLSARLRIRCLNISLATFNESACRNSGSISNMSNSKGGTTNSLCPLCLAAKSPRTVA
eukprot:6210810-Pleurochrysis_carterae.AAC.1